MKIKTVFLVSKKSVYEEWALEKKDRQFLRLLKRDRRVLHQLKKPHEEHSASVEIVKKSLTRLGLSYKVTQRYQIKRPLKADLIISLGGDGTFLETSHFVKNGLVMGVNSMPHFSVGHFCRTMASTFESKMKRLLANKARILSLQRLQVAINRKIFPLPILNDILFSNLNPAAISRYEIAVRGKKERQRSSGIWIATAAGSSAALQSAGGLTLPLQSTHFCYRVREPFAFLGRQALLLGGPFKKNETLVLKSEMHHGALFIDGPHHKILLERGDLIQIKPSKNPLKTVW